MLRSIDAAGTQDATRILRAQTRVRVDAGETPTIRVPSWDDIVRVGPRPTVTPEDRAIQRHFERAGLPSPLDPALQQEIFRRREMAKHLANSPLPEYQQGVTAAMTAVDNVQDAATTAMVATRVSIPLLGQLGTYLAPAVLAFGQIATALNWLFAGLFAWGIAYAAACQGPRAAVAQASVPAFAGLLFKGLRPFLPRGRGIPHPIPGQWQKGRMAAMMMGNPEGRRLTNARASRWARMRIGFGEALQIAQTATDVIGYGLSLGAVYGFVAETVYTGTRAGKGAPVTTRSPRVNHVLAEILGPHVEILSPAALWHREQCCRALAATPLILRDPETFGPELYALSWLTYYVSLEPLMWDAHGLRWRDAVIDALPASWRAWDVRDELTRDHLVAAGVDPDTERRWPVPGAPLELTTEQLVLEIGPEIGRALSRFLHEAPFDPLRRFVAELSVRVCERVWYFLEASPHYPTWELSPTTAVWESLVQADRWPIVSDPPDAILTAWANCERLVETTGRKYIDVEQLDRIWSDAGSPLLRITGGDGSLPIEHLTPWDPETGAPGETAFGSSVEEARRRLTELMGLNQ